MNMNILKHSNYCLLDFDISKTLFSSLLIYSRKILRVPFLTHSDLIKNQDLVNNQDVEDLVKNQDLEQDLVNNQDVEDLVNVLYKDLMDLINV